MKTFAEIWEELEDIPFDDIGGELYLAQDWYIFKKGTYREDIWHYLEEFYGVAIGDLL